MKRLVKEFIEKNIALIEDEDYYDDLYDQAYENLPDDYVTELTAILSETLDEDFSKYAKQNIIKHVNIELNNFLLNEHDTLTLSSFVRMYMNHINGLDWDEFQQLVEQELKGSNLFKVHHDDEGDLYITKKG